MRNEQKRSNDQPDKTININKTTEFGKGYRVGLIFSRCQVVHEYYFFSNKNVSTRYFLPTNSSNLNWTYDS